jgi:tRNA (guanine37-N1)-methyltransferase
MDFHILTLFPEMIKQGVNHSILKKAIENNIITVNPVDIRDFSNNKHKQIDDTPYGGGSGMVIKPEPVFSAYSHIKKNTTNNVKVVFMTPQGIPFSQKKAYELSREDSLIFLCGHYEGVDQRVIDEIVTDEISIGDYILTGGELACLVVMDSISRLIPGVLSNESSHIEESFSDGLLEYPHYTRPYVFMNKKVPDILISGHHENIKKWRRMQSLTYTRDKRPDLLANAELSDEELLFLKNI